MAFFLSILIMVIGACLFVFGAAAALGGFVYFMGELWDTL